MKIANLFRILRKNVANSVRVQFLLQCFIRNYVHSNKDVKQLPSSFQCLSATASCGAHHAITVVVRTLAFDSAHAFSLHNDEANASREFSVMTRERCAFSVLSDSLLVCYRVTTNPWVKADSLFRYPEPWSQRKLPSKLFFVSFSTRVRCRSCGVDCVRNCGFVETWRCPAQATNSIGIGLFLTVYKSWNFVSRSVVHPCSVVHSYATAIMNRLVSNQYIDPAHERAHMTQQILIMDGIFLTINKS